MARLIDAVVAIHNAFRNDIDAIDAAAFEAAKGKGDLSAVIARYSFFNEILVWHADGEEDAVFPAIEKVAPLVAEAYEADHRGLDRLFESLTSAISSSDALVTARVTAAFKFHLAHHLDKEDTHLYRIMREQIEMPEQGQMVGKMASGVPMDRFPELVAWMFPLMGHDDRENMTRIWKMVMPEPAFEGAKGLIEKAIGDDWAELTKRIPELVG
ncbi:MAG: hemerythrin domain-containing protein [Chloroflexi bacterium]|nr:hemerythrin domain-containing protein [Chloroflexota bacterium]